MDEMSSGDEFDAGPMSKDMLEHIRDGIQYHTSINLRDACYKLCGQIKQDQAEWKWALLSMQNMVKGLHKEFKAVVNEILQDLPILDESGSEASYFIIEPINFAEVTRLS